MTANGYRVSFWADKNDLELVMLYNEMYSTYLYNELCIMRTMSIHKKILNCTHQKINFMGSQLYLNKAYF